MTDENKVKTKKTEKVSCGFCGKKCSGNVLKVQERYFHIECFKCQKCKISLAQDGFFLKDGKYFCSKDYQKLFGTKCSVCKEFVQGEVVTALGKTYHQKCFACAKCNFIFPPGDKVIFYKNECLCSNCVQKYNLDDKNIEDNNLKKKLKKDKNNNITKSLPLNLDKKLGLKKSDKKNDKKDEKKDEKNENDQKLLLQKENQKDSIKCAGCGESFNEKTKDQLNNRSSSRQSGRSVKIQSDQLKSPTKEKSILFALDKHWHESCFKCNTCHMPLFNKEYMTTTVKVEKNERKSTESLKNQSFAHCMTCYKAKLGVYCVHCKRPIEGKVLQAGEELHFHPSCARCCKCGDRFTHAQEMFVQGKAIWHAQCEGLRYEQLENHHNSPYLRSRSLPRSQPISPYGSLYQIHRTQHISPVSLDHHHKLNSMAINRSYKERGQTLPANLSPLSTVYSYSYLTNNEPNLTYLKKPLQPQNANSPQYHLPGDYPYRSRSNFSRSSSATRSSPNLMSGMRALVETLHPHYRSISPSERSIRKQHNKNRIAVKARISNSNLKGTDQIDNEMDKNKNFDSNEQVHDQTMDDLSDENPSDSSLRQQLMSTNEEVIELAHYPDARKPFSDEVAPIERDDFPAPPFPLSVSRNSHRSVKSSSSSIGLRNNIRSSSRVRQQNTTNNKTMNSNGNTSEDEAEEEKTEEIDLDIDDLSDPLEINRRQNLHDQLRKEEEELRKLGSGIGQVFLNNLKEREKRLREFHLDPRNASRTPSARVESQKRLRYKNPVNASPSRFLDHYKSWEDEELDQFSIYRSSNGRSSNYTAPYNIVSSQRLTPKPGYSLKKDNTNYALDNNLDKTQSIDFNCGKSDLSANLELDRNYINRSISGTFGLSPYSDLYRASLMRNSMPNVNIHKSNEPPKLYPYHLLIITNYRLPPDVDRCHLEAHLSNEEFGMLFQMTRLDFYRLPEWKRNELKKRVKLF